MSASISSEHMSTVNSMNVDDTGSLGGGSDHNWIQLVLADKFRRLGRAKQIPEKKKTWNLSGDFKWTDFTKSVLKHLPVDGWEEMSVDVHAKELVSALHHAGGRGIRA